MNNIFDSSAVISLTVLLLIICYTLLSNYFNKDLRRFWAPDTFVCLIFLYYSLYGPLLSIIKGDTTYRHFDVSAFYSLSWMGAAVNLLFFKIGFTLKCKPIRFLNFIYPPKKIRNAALLVFFLGILMIISWGGISLSSLFGHNSNVENN